jgi:hypothetical protein
MTTRCGHYRKANIASIEHRLKWMSLIIKDVIVKEDKVNMPTRGWSVDEGAFAIICNMWKWTLQSNGCKNITLCLMSYYICYHEVHLNKKIDFWIDGLNKITRKACDWKMGLWRPIDGKGSKALQSPIKFAWLETTSPKQIYLLPASYYNLPDWSTGRAVQLFEFK